MANISKSLHINFYQNRSSIVEVTIKKFWCVFYAPQCIDMEWIAWLKGVKTAKRAVLMVVNAFHSEQGASVGLITPA